MESELKKKAFIHTKYYCKECGQFRTNPNEYCGCGNYAWREENLSVLVLPVTEIKKWLEEKKAHYKNCEDKKIYVAGLIGKYQLINEQIQELCLLETAFEPFCEKGSRKNDHEKAGEKRKEGEK